MGYRMQWQRCRISLPLHLYLAHGLGNGVHARLCTNSLQEPSIRHPTVQRAWRLAFPTADEGSVGGKDINFPSRRQDRALPSAAVPWQVTPSPSQIKLKSARLHVAHLVKCRSKDFPLTIVPIRKGYGMGRNAYNGSLIGRGVQRPAHEGCERPPRFMKRTRGGV